MATAFTLPELGENVESGSVVSILVTEGDRIKAEEILLELETEKAVIEVPAVADGVISKVMVKEGDEIRVGQTIFLIEEGGSDTTVETEKEKAAERSLREPAAIKEPETVEQASEPEKQREPVAAKARVEMSTESRTPVPAAPSVRRFAREIGIEIFDVVGSGPGGRISKDDVKRHSKKLHEQRAAAPTAVGTLQPDPLPDFSKWGPIDRQRMSKVRQTTARHLGKAWASIPHVTQFDKADVTDLEDLRRRYATKAEEAGGKLTVTAMLLKIVQLGLKVFPQFNASIDIQNSEVIFKKYVNIGVAVDTDRGLLVPVIRDVDKKSMIQLSVELIEISQKARNRKLTLEDMQGGNFSISNLGGIGGTGFAPIVNAPEVAILGVSRSQWEPRYSDDQFVSRLMLPLSLSYDHRIIDGVDGVRFLRWVVEVLENPFRLVLEME